jgi:hypothetical protein
MRCCILAVGERSRRSTTSARAAGDGEAAGAAGEAEGYAAARRNCMGEIVMTG